jgi:GNAT superfamily N-acetyltransferase
VGRFRLASSSHDQLAAMLAETAGSRPPRLAWWAIASETCVAHVQIALDWSNGVGRLARIADAPALRSHGIGYEMLMRVIAEAFSANKLERLELNVSPTIPRLLHLYAARLHPRTDTTICRSRR